jgi:hypothetical protein
MPPQKSTDTLIKLLRTGDLVLRMGKGPNSYMLAQLNPADKSWSHCGLVVVEHGYPFIYHSIGGEDNPDERLRRDSAGYFVSPVRNLACGIVRYNWDSATAALITSGIRQMYAARPRFDLDFDLATDDRLYCSEFVYKVCTRALNDTTVFRISNGYNRRYVGIDALYLTPRARFVYRISY